MRAIPFFALLLFGGCLLSTTPRAGEVVLEGYVAGGDLDDLRVVPGAQVTAVVYPGGQCGVGTAWPAVSDVASPEGVYRIALVAPDRFEGAACVALTFVPPVAADLPSRTFPLYPVRFISGLRDAIRYDGVLVGDDEGES
jgi:hypothetical protein